MLRSLISSTMLLALVACGGSSDGLSNEEQAFVAAATPYCDTLNAELGETRWYSCQALIEYPGEVVRLDNVIIDGTKTSAMLTWRETSTRSPRSAVGAVDGPVVLRNGTIVGPQDPGYAAVEAKWLAQ